MKDRIYEVNFNTPNDSSNLQTIFVKTNKISEVEKVISNLYGENAKIISINVHIDNDELIEVDSYNNELIVPEQI